MLMPRAILKKIVNIPAEQLKGFLKSLLDELIANKVLVLPP
jgi:hypothetical protein